MKILLSAVVLGAVLALTSGTAKAACGGGGFHPADSKDPKAAAMKAGTVVSSTVVSSTTTSSKSVTPASVTTTTTASAKPATTTVSTPVATEVYAVALDSTRFDAASSRLDLSERQWKDINKAKEKVRDQSEKLVKNQNKAQAKYARCTGDCESEMKKLSKTTDELRSYNPNEDFQQRLSSILSSSQMATLQGDKSAVSDAKKNP